MSTTSTKKFLNFTKALLKRASIRLLLGVMVLSSFLISSPVSAVMSRPQLSITATEISGDFKTVTVSMNVYSTPTSTLDALKNAITVKRTGSTDYTALGSNDSVALINDLDSSTSKLFVTFDNALTGRNNSMIIASGALMDRNGVSFAQADLVLDITPPAYIGSSSDNGNYVYLNFDENFSINSGSVAVATYLRSKISIATDGVNFVPFSEQGSALQYNSTIYLNYNNDMKIILGTKTLIKIGSGTLKDAAGNLNAEMILHVTPPVIQSTEISNFNHDVTITFQEGVVDNTYSPESHLREYIYLFKDAANFDSKALVTGDTVSVVAGKLVIHFAEALTGATNQIKINSGALKDAYGNVLRNHTITQFIQANKEVVDPNPAIDTTAPKYVKAYFSNSNHDITLEFDENVLNNKIDAANFNSAITFNGTRGIPNFPDFPDATLTFSGHYLNIHFTEPLNGEYRLEFAPNSFKDTSGNVLNQYIYTGWMYALQTLSTDGGSFSHNSRWMNLHFNGNLADATIVDGISHLKEKITISTDQGLTFTALSAQDVVSIQGDRVVVLFHEAKKTGTVRVKIEADALSDEHNNVKNSAIDQVVAYNNPDVAGYFLSNAASELLFEDNDVWRSKVKDIVINDESHGVGRVLNSSEYTLTAGKLTIKPGVFQKGVYYYISIDADGYSSKYLDGTAFTSSEIFNVTAPVLTKVGGITATINVLNNDLNYYLYNQYLNATTGTQSVVFELMNGTTPVSIVAANLKVNTGTYSANFNVSDADTNPNYSVKAFIVNKFTDDLTNVGLNMATQLTQAELNLKQNQQEIDRQNSRD